MENAAEALKIAAAVLIFVLALSICINAFGEVRQTSDIIMQYNDKEYEYMYRYVKEGNTERIVGAETIIPAIYKAYKENYKIVFSKFDNEGLYKKKNKENAQYEPVYKIDLENEVLGNEIQKQQFLNDILYGTQEISKFEANLEILLNNVGLYDKIKEMKFTEQLGVYYQEDIKKIVDSNDSNNTTGESTPETNKTKKRVITYTKYQ